MLLLYLLLHVFSSTILASAATPSLPPDAAALLAFKSKSDLGNKLSFLVNRSSIYDNHCTWPGVQCSSESKVTRLVLEGYGLNGTFANGTLGRLDQLRILSLKGNSLTGPVPDLSGLVNLKALFLGYNRFAGPFPTSIVSLHRLRTLDLSHNNFTGPIPSEINSLGRLYCLRLESNRFNGSIPPLNQTTLRIFNVSRNELSGAIPVTDTLSSFDASAFSENPGLCGEVVRKECRSHLFFFRGGPGPSSMAPAPAAPAAPAVKGGQLDDQGFTLPGSGSGSSDSSALKFRKRATVVIWLVAGAFLVIGFVAVLIVMKNKSRKMRQGKILSTEKNSEVLVESNINENSSNVLNPIDQIENSNNELVAATTMSEEKVKKLGKSGCLVFCAGEAQVYTLEQLMRASAEMLGRGSVGSTYKAVLDNRLIVSVKRLDATKMGSTGKETFERHMDAVGRLRHPNLVPLRAFFQAKEERLLVYDYQPNGSLFSLIHGLCLALIIIFEQLLMFFLLK